MPLVISQNDFTYTNDLTVTGAPAVRIAGARVRFVNSESGRAISTGVGQPAILIEGEGAVIVNEAGGVIRSDAESEFVAVVIVGSAFADRVENAGLIRGRVALGEGADTYVSRVLNNEVNTPVDLGGGDDFFFVRPAPVFSIGPSVDGGEGFDRLVMFESDGNIGGGLVRNVEILELRMDGFVESFSGLAEVIADYRGADRLFNALRFFNSPDAAISMIAGSVPTNLGIYDRSKIGSITGSDAIDAVNLGSDTLVSGAIALGAGDDTLSFFRSQFEAALQTSFGTGIDGGTGRDTLDLQLRGGDLFNAGNISGFEAARIGATSAGLGGPLVVSNLAGFSEVVIAQFQAAPVRLDGANLPTGLVTVQPRTSLTVAASSILGTIVSFTPFPLDTPFADDTQSLSIVNHGQILGEVRMYIGDDLFDSRLGTVGGTVYGYAGNDTIMTGAGNDRLEGGAGGDFLSGGAGDDDLSGGSANDVLDGGAGADLLRGGTGNDAYLVDAADSAAELAGEGHDTVYALTSHALAAGSEVEVLTVYDRDTTNAINLTGNALSNTIYGNNGSNTLIGGGGSDSLYGMAGDDRFLVDDASDIVFEFAGGGHDTVYATGSHALAAGAEVEVLTVYDRDTVNAVNLTGNEFSNLIYGNNGSNALIGGGGADSFYGLGGDDRYLVDSSSASVFETAGQGYDTVYTFGDFALNNASSVEALSVYDRDTTNALTLFGNNIDNVIYGNQGSNALFGGGGEDTFYGLGGDDRYFVDSLGDQVIEVAGGGNDTVYTTLGSYSLITDQSVETLTVYDRDTVYAANLAGNNLVNLIYGNAGANNIDGKGGADTLYGMAGADTFTFTAAPIAGAADALADFSAADDTIALDDVAFLGIGSPGALNPNAFVIGSAAGDADDRIVYNQATGQLFFDADGNGSGSAVLFATLNAGTALTASDFTVI